MTGGAGGWAGALVGGVRAGSEASGGQRGAACSAQLRRRLATARHPPSHAHTHTHAPCPYPTAFSPLRQVTEEEDDPIFIEEGHRGDYCVVFDPLDGSSNIDCGVSGERARAGGWAGGRAQEWGGEGRRVSV